MVGETRTGVYRAGTEDEANAAYHVAAAAAAAEGFVPVAEQWTTALGQRVLTVTYVHAPDQAPGILETLRRQDIDPHRCPACGKPLSPTWRDKCEHCKTPFSPELLAARQRAPAISPGPAPQAPLGTMAIDRSTQASAYRRQVGWGCLGYVMVVAGLVLGFIVAALFAAQLTSNVLLQLLLAFVVGPLLGAFLAWYLWTQLWGRG